MTMRKRLLLSATAFVGLVCVVLLVLAMLPPRPGVTKANFDRIETGMTMAEVEGILGRKGMRALAAQPNQGTELIWLEADWSHASIVFIDERVDEKRWVDSNETVWTKFRRWLRLSPDALLD